MHAWRMLFNKYNATLHTISEKLTQHLTTKFVCNRSTNCFRYCTYIIYYFIIDERSARIGGASANIILLFLT
jgi:hypothetical protein